jgi:hypothetical protein
MLDYLVKNKDRLKDIVYDELLVGEWHAIVAALCHSTETPVDVIKHIATSEHTHLASIAVTSSKLCTENISSLIEYWKDRSSLVMFSLAKSPNLNQEHRDCFFQNMDTAKAMVSTHPNLSDRDIDKVLARLELWVSLVENKTTTPENLTKLVEICYEKTCSSQVLLKISLHPNANKEVLLKMIDFFKTNEWSDRHNVSNIVANIIKRSKDVDVLTSLLTCTNDINHNSNLIARRRGDIIKKLKKFLDKKQIAKIVKKIKTRDKIMGGVR